MRNPLQDQLLKAGLVKKSQVAQVAREQAKQRHAKGVAAPAAEPSDAARAHAARVQRDRALAAERNALLRAQEQQAQARQLVEAHRLPSVGEIAYRFVDGATIRTLHVDAAQRAQLAGGALVIARLGEGHVLLPRAAGEKVRARDARMIVVDHGQAPAAAPGDVDAFYARFEVPDDLTW
jgi:hypothetical protein